MWQCLCQLTGSCTKATQVRGLRLQADVRVATCMELDHRQHMRMDSRVPVNGQQTSGNCTCKQCKVGCMKWGGQQMCDEELHRRAVQIVLQPGSSRQKLVTCKENASKQEVAAACFFVSHSQGDSAHITSGG